jgi:peroxiredoxin
LSVGEIGALEDSPYLELKESVCRQFQRRKALGLARYHLGDTEGGDRELFAVKRLLEEQLESQNRDYAKAEAEAIRSGATNAATGRAAVDRRYRQRLAVLEKTINELAGYGALARGDLGGARQYFEKPTNISPEQLARAYWRLGDRTAALEQASLAVERNPNQVLPLAIQAGLLWRAGEKASAIEAFRALSGSLELAAPAFKRLGAIARELRLPADWRLVRDQSGEARGGVDLAELGPLKWSPYAAPNWILSDASGASVDLRSFRGKPVIVIFYLGRGCAYYIEQLNAFATMAEDYTRAGISLIAISTDTVDGLKKTAEFSDIAWGFPFSLLADPGLGAFKAYRAHDDFEGFALHGTFLIDGEGKVRWQDIGAEPFMETKFLLDESLRLLKISEF